MAIDDLRMAIRQTLLEGLPANTNTPSAFIDLRAARPERIEQLIAELDRHVPRGRTYERPGRVILHPAPYIRSAINRAG